MNPYLSFYREEKVLIFIYREEKYLYLFRQVCFKFKNLTKSVLNLHLVLESFVREMKTHFNRSMQLEEK